MDPNAEELGRRLAARTALLAVAESCTGGLVAKRITDVAGSSGWFERGLVVYSNRAKQDLLGVPAELLEQFGAVSRECAEAMARGLPVVASDIPPNRELVVDGEAGFLVQVGDSVGFSQFTDRILADPELARRLGTAGRTRMQEHFSIARMVNAHAALYRSLAAEELEPE